MIEPLLFGIVLGMMSVSLAGLFVAAWLQKTYARILLNLFNTYFM